MNKTWTIVLISAGSTLTAAAISTVSFFLGKRSGIRAHAAGKYDVDSTGKVRYMKPASQETASDAAAC